MVSAMTEHMDALSKVGSPSLAAVECFMANLERVRSALPPETWRARVRSDPSIRRWRYFLTQDPYTRWGLLKPRGYPGDALLMDFAYDHLSIQEHVQAAGDIGREIYCHTMSAAQSASARLRLSLIGAMIEHRIAAEGSVTINAFASGHAREIEQISTSALSSIKRFCAIDLDAESLRIASDVVGADVFIAVRRNVIKDDLSEVPRASLVYALGLFDYLIRETAITVLLRMWDTTSPGGLCIVANLATDAANLGYCEAIMDWWMIARSESEMFQLGESVVRQAGDVSAVHVTRHGCFYFLALMKQ